jgi:large subunit ribosomal protein L21
MSNYAIISVGGKQYSVREGEKLLVDRVKTDEGKTFHPDILFAGGDGKADFKPKIQVTAKVLGHVKGEKIRIGKYRRRTGYRRHNGYRSSLSQIEITAIGAKRSTAAKKPATAKKPASTTKKEES